jgi:hypothetical protein
LKIKKSGSYSNIVPKRDIFFSFLFSTDGLALDISQRRFFARLTASTTVVFLSQTLQQV